MPGSPAKPVEIALRVAFGTGVYALIVIMAGHFPAAAGLMLTFPALNGLAFILSRQDSVGAITTTMLWMPLLNGLLCTAWLLLFLLFATPALAAPLAWGLTAGVALLWLLLVTRRPVQAGIKARRQGRYAFGVAAGGLVLTLLWWMFAGNAGTDIGGSRPALTWQKTLLFAAALWLLIVLPPRFRWKDGASGILSGLPLVALAGLLSVAQDQAITFDARRALFMQMMFGVWLAPAMAVGFIHATSQWLLRPRAHRRRVAVVSAGWLSCLAVILAAGMALQWLAAR